jgi:hypothetical protein
LNVLRSREAKVLEDASNWKAYPRQSLKMTPNPVAKAGTKKLITCCVVLRLYFCGTISGQSQRIQKILAVAAARSMESRCKAPDTESNRLIRAIVEELTTKSTRCNPGDEDGCKLRDEDEINYS